MLPAPAQVKKNLLVSIATRHRRGDFSCYREAVFLADQSDMPHRPLTHGGIAGQTVVVAGGAGAVGHYAVQVASRLGAASQSSTAKPPVDSWRV